MISLRDIIVFVMFMSLFVFSDGLVVVLVLGNIVMFVLLLLWLIFSVCVFV